MTISTNIHNHIQAQTTNQVNFVNKLFSLTFSTISYKIFLLRNKKSTKGAKGIISYLFSPYTDINATVYQEYSVDVPISFQLSRVYPIAFSSLSNTQINYKRLTEYFIKFFYFDKLIHARAKSFAYLLPYYKGGKI